MRVTQRWHPRMGNGHDEMIGAKTGSRQLFESRFPERNLSGYWAEDRTDDRPVVLGRMPGEENVALADAGGRVLAQDVRSRLPVPNWPLASVFGWAVRISDFSGASNRKPVTANRSFDVKVHDSRWWTIGFGAQAWLPYERRQDGPELFLCGPLKPLPFDTDAVLNDLSPFLKGVTISQKRRFGSVIEPVPPGHNVISRGADFQEGETLLSRGQRLGAKELAMLGTAGINQVEVFRKPKLGVLVHHVRLRPPGHEAPIGWLADGITPMVLELLARWGFDVAQIHTVALEEAQGQGEPFDGEQAEAFFRSFDFSVLIGGRFHTRSNPQTRTKYPPTVSYGCTSIPSHFFEVDESESNGTVEAAPPGYDTWFKGLGQAGVVRTVVKEGPLPEVQGMPLGWFARVSDMPMQALIEMYLVVRPALLALAGVGDFPVLANQHEAGRVNGSLRIDPQAPLAPAKMPQGLPAARAHVPLSEQPGAGPVDPDTYAKALARFAEGASKERWRRQNTRWFTGVLLNPAPRDPERHWLQLAQLESQDDGRMGVRVLPTEEYQVRHLNEAEAICMIDKASSPEETEFPAGTVVHYFLLD